MKSDDSYWFDLFSRRLTRRDFVRLGRDAAACIALSSIPMPRGGARPRLTADPFHAGVASGDPMDTSVVLWTMLDPLALAAPGTVRAPVEVSWEIAADDSFRRIVRKGSAPATGELGHSVHVEANGLEPGREYWYRFMLGGATSRVGRAVTAASRRTSLAQFRFAFASCQNF
jgi:alkaline phosphatase D